MTDAVLVDTVDNHLSSENFKSEETLTEPKTDINNVKLETDINDNNVSNNVNNNTNANPSIDIDDDAAEPYTIPWLIWLWHLNVIGKVICDFFIGENPHNIHVDWNTIPEMFHNLFRIPYIAQDSKEWFDIKRFALSGSEMGAILGQNKKGWTTAGEVYYQKNNMGPRLPRGDWAKVAMQHGKDKEDKASYEWCLEHHDVAFKLGFVPSLKYHFLGMSPDRFTLSGNLLEIKCHYEKYIDPNMDHEAMREDMPHYHSQCQLQAFILSEYLPPDVLKDVKFVQFGCAPARRYIEKSFLKETSVPVLPSWIEDNIERLSFFWSKIEEYRKENPNWKDRKWPSEDEVTPEQVKESRALIRKIDEMLGISDLSDDTDPCGLEDNLPPIKKQCPFQTRRSVSTKIVKSGSSLSSKKRRFDETTNSSIVENIKPKETDSNVDKNTPRVVHCMREDYDVYIGRYNPKVLKEKAFGFKFGNPFKIGPDGTREQVIEKYRVWIHADKQKQLYEQIKTELKGKSLGCFCRPEYACHGDVILEIANNTINSNINSNINMNNNNTNINTSQKQNTPNKRVKCPF